MSKLKLMRISSCTVWSTKYEKETFSKFFVQAHNLPEMFIKQITKFGEWNYYIHVINTITSNIEIAIV